MKHILVPYDFSPIARNALQYAINLARQYQSKITLFHAYSPASIEPYMAVYMQDALLNQREELALKQFQELKAEIPYKWLQTIQLEFKITLGPAVEEIVRTCNELEPDLIVMGMRGGHVLEKKILGSTVAGIVQRINKPLLVIPENVEYEAIKNVAFATNYEEEDTKVLDWLLQFAKFYDAKVYCLHILKNGNAGEEYKRIILERAYRHEIIMHNLEFDTMEYEEVVGGLNRYAVENNIQMMVMLTHHRSLFSQIFHKSYTKRLVLRAEIPLLVFQMHGNDIQQ